MRSTADLYRPLQTALNKSMVQDPYLSRTKQLAYQKVGRTSRVSKRMKSLSPEQAHHIKQSTILPVDKVLVPTDHLWRVKDKKFSAVNVEVKEGRPIPSHLMRIPPGNNNYQVTTQTVYQALPRTQLFPTYIPNPPQITTQTNTYSPRNSITMYSRVIPIQTVSNNIQRPASPVLVNSRPNIFNHQRYSNHQTQNLENNQLQGNNGNNFKPQQEIYNSSNQYYNPERSNISELFEAPKKKKYKYNCFSALDQPINTHCSSCGPNEIIATKPYTSWQ